MSCRRGGAGWPGCRNECGWTLVELLVGLAVLALLATLSLPSLAGSVRHYRLESITRELALEMQAARWRALGGGTYTGLKFTGGAAGELSWVMVRDGDGDGLRSVDLRDGTDVAVAPEMRLADRAPGIRAGILSDRRVPRIPPQSGWLDRPEDPIRFGSADLVSFAPGGSATPGSLYLTDGGRMTAVVVNGVTGRLRLFRLAEREDNWKELQ